MAPPFSPPLEPMLALAQDEIPSGEGWHYEPKWDGFRCIVFRDGDDVHFHSRNGQPLQRYFPELVAAIKQTLPARCVVDGEIILPGPKGLDFEALQQRIHPAASRVNKLAAETPTSFVAFDLLGLGDEDLRALANGQRRARLVASFTSQQRVFTTPQTANVQLARDWFRQFEGAGCDGVIARRDELPYTPGKRVMVKVKHGRMADCVVSAYREGKTPGSVGSLLLGLYDSAGALHQVGHTSSFSAKEKRALLEKLKPLETGEKFGGPQSPVPEATNRWARGKEQAPMVMLRPELVCEVRYDYLQGARFRHATTFQRWRTDKPPADCTYDQLAPPNPFSLQAIIDLAKGT